MAGRARQARAARADYTHDVKAMLAADPDAGLFYICTPNNPTGTITPLADIEWLIANKPAGSMVLIDEAYTHFADVPTCSHTWRRPART
jgi:histidinol-phosphate aminotransferase